MRDSSRVKWKDTKYDQVGNAIGESEYRTGTIIQWLDGGRQSYPYAVVLPDDVDVFAWIEIWRISLC